MSTHLNTKKVQRTFHIRLTLAVVIWLAVVVACQPIAATPILPTPTLHQPITTGTSTAALGSGLSSDTLTPPTISQTATLTPTLVPPDEDAPIVLVGTIIDGTGAEPLEDAAIVIQDGNITAVGFRENVAFPADAHIIELQDATILPGLINSHVHNAYEPFLLEKWAQAGITTVRDLGAKFPFFRFSARDQNNKDPKFATVISAGPLITVPGGYPIVGNNFPSLAVTNPDHARREVAQLIMDGADVIKIVIESSGGLPTLSLETASAIVETAHQWDVPVTVHLTSLKDLKLALDAGVDAIAHIVPDEQIPADVLEQMVVNNVYWVPTLEPFGGHGAGNLGSFIALGGSIALGNDGGLLPGIELGMPMREIEMMQAAGMSPMEIIVAATRNAAYICNLEDRLGTLEVGKTADILVVNGDPLINLQTMTDVRLVIHQGRLIRDSSQR